jgi:hypothetical protein
MRACVRTIVGLVSLVGSASLSSAAIRHVHVTGNDSCDGIVCAKRTIQSAVDAAQPGDQIRIHPGTFVENVIVGKPLALRGAGQDRTTILPAFSGPETCSDASVCDDLSNVILIQSSGVSVSSLTIDGDNPELTGGIDIGGANVDARNGIIDDRRLGIPFDDLHVSQVTVKNVFLRGIQLGTDGIRTLIDHCTVSNVAGNYGSKCIVKIGGKGEIVQNWMADSMEGVAVANSQGTRVLNNYVTRSVYGMETDWAGDSEGEVDRGETNPDLIEGNTVTDCVQDSYGIQVWLPKVPATVRGNYVRNCLVPLSVLGSDGAEVGPSALINNTAVGNAAAGSVGVLVSSATGYPENSDVAVSLSGNRLYGFERGVVIQANDKTATATLSDGVIVNSAVGIDNGGALALESTCLYRNGTSLLVQESGTLVARRNDILDSGTLSVKNLNPSTPVDARLNWWGSRFGPDPAKIVGDVATKPFLTHPVGCGRR